MMASRRSKAMQQPRSTLDRPVIAEARRQVGLLPEAEDDAASEELQPAASRSVIVILAVTAATLVGAMFQSHSSQCSADPAVLSAAPSTAARMFAWKGRACSLSIRSTAHSLHDIRLTRNPGHGRVSFRGNTGVIYNADRGFTGEDGFSFAVAVDARPRSTTARYDVRVSVQ